MLFVVFPDDRAICIGAFIELPALVAAGFAVSAATALHDTAAESLARVVGNIGRASHLRCVFAVREELNHNLVTLYIGQGVYLVAIRRVSANFHLYMSY